MARNRKKPTGEPAAEKTTVTYHDVEITGTATVEGSSVTLTDVEVKARADREAADMIEALRIRTETDPGAPPVMLDVATAERLARCDSPVPDAYPPVVAERLEVPPDAARTERREEGTVTVAIGSHRHVLWVGRWEEYFFVGNGGIYCPELAGMHAGQRFEATVVRSVPSGRAIRLFEVKPLPPADSEFGASHPPIPNHIVRAVPPAPLRWEYADESILRCDFAARQEARTSDGWELFSVSVERRHQGLEFITIWKRPRPVTVEPTKE